MLHTEVKTNVLSSITQQKWSVPTRRVSSATEKKQHDTMRPSVAAHKNRNLHALDFYLLSVPKLRLISAYGTFVGATCWHLFCCTPNSCGSNHLIGVLPFPWLSETIEPPATKMQVCASFQCLLQITDNSAKFRWHSWEYLVIYSLQLSAGEVVGLGRNLLLSRW